MPTGYIVREGYPLIFGTAVLAAILWYRFGAVWAVIPFLLCCFFTFFFRNPSRIIDADERLLASPADGKVMDVSEVYEDLFLHEDCIKVTIFLSVFDVHVNRAPMAGNITFRQYSEGRFLPAYKDSVGYENERHSVGISNGTHEILVTQIAGLLARRIVSWTDLGDNVEKGQLYGMIKFGSCTELFLPKGTEIYVEKGAHVSGGETVIGRLP